MRRAAIAVGVAFAAVFGAATLLGGWFLMAAGANDERASCSASTLDAKHVPPQLVPVFAAAAQRYGLGAQGPAVLAGLTSIESDFGRNQGPSSAGAVGWTQFLPATWQLFGVDADGDGRRDPGDPADAIFAAANYLRHLGAPGDWHRALLGYNHSEAYVASVLGRADDLSNAGAVTEACAPAPAAGGRITGAGHIVPIPGQPGESIDERILRDVLRLQRQYRFTVTDGFAPTGHAAGGEHPIGLAIDVVPGPGGSWDDLDDLARLAEPQPDHPAPPFRWVGYDGDTGHGRGNHLHLSWQHGPAREGNRPPAAWVDVLGAP